MQWVDTVVVCGSNFTPELLHVAVCVHILCLDYGLFVESEVGNKQYLMNL